MSSTFEVVSLIRSPKIRDKFYAMYFDWVILIIEITSQSQLSPKLTLSSKQG